MPTSIQLFNKSLQRFLLTNENQVLIRKVGIYLDMGQNIVLIKDAQKDVDMIIRAVLEEKKDTHKVIKIDMLKMSSHRDISDLIVNQVNEFLDQDQTVEEFYDKEDAYRYLCHAVELPEKIAKIINNKIIFIINELEHVADFDTDFKTEEVMRSYFQHQHNVIFVFTGTSKTLMKNVFQDIHAPFFRFAEKVE